MKNVLWIFGDQHRGQALSCAGDPNVATPNIDLLAAHGIRATRAYSSCPLCCPQRGTLLTGLHAKDCVPAHQAQLDPEVPTLADAFRSAGYETAWFGKWHVDGGREDGSGNMAHHIVPPERRGRFDTWVGYENNNDAFDCWVHGGEGDAAFHERLEGYETVALTDRLLSWLDGRQGPFFAALSVQPPHDPMVAPEEFMGRHTPSATRLRPNVPAIPAVEERARLEGAGYAAAVECLDAQVGRIVAKLRETGLWDETHVVFFSDHGEMGGSQGRFRKTVPFEESANVPLVIGGAGSMYAHRKGVIRAPISLLDLPPTTLGLAGIEPPSAMRGRDLSGLRRKDLPQPEMTEDVLIGLPVPTKHGDSVEHGWRAIVTPEGWKYAAFEFGPWRMHDLNSDPYELRDLAHEPKARARRLDLQDRLAKVLDDAGDGFNVFRG